MKKFIFILFASLGFVSCSAFLSFDVIDDHTAHIVLEGDLGPVIMEMISSATQGIDEVAGQESVLFDKEAVEQGLKHSCVKDYSVEILSASKIRIKGVVDFNELESDLFVVKNGSVEMQSSAAAIRSFASIFGEELMSYADLLMAPVFSEMPMERDEYLDLLKSVYGKKLADEMEKSRITWKARSVDGKITEQTIPLMNMLLKCD